MSLSFQKQPNKRVKKYLIVVLLPFLLLLLFYGVYKIFLVAPPKIEGLEAFEFLPAKKTVHIKGQNIQKIEIHIKQGVKDIEILRESPEKALVEYRLEIDPKALGLTDGTAVVSVVARSSLIKKFQRDIKAEIDTVAPRLQIVNAPTLVRQGETGRAILHAVDADTVYITYGTYQFKAYETNRNSYFVLFPVPYNSKKGDVFYAVARDRAGNITTRALPTRIREGSFRKSTIKISDDFIQRVVFPLLNQSEVDDPDPVSAFKKVNEDWRKRDTARVYEIGQNSISERLWKGRFLQLKNSKVMARYGDRRIYTYRGKVISNSVHLGFDLASTTFAPVEAANTGEVRFVGDMGIYGNTVIIDHGQGLMSLYGHLSEIFVKKGDRVKKGDLIARTGSTGFAGGDHLHFGILVQGGFTSILVGLAMD
ncbi:MAG: M23 family metallopeptidase [Nitrospirae bacterium]|nr:M23 family metallopeptidase [Nitrospirota bacterium]